MLPREVVWDIAHALLDMSSAACGCIDYPHGKKEHLSRLIAGYENPVLCGRGFSIAGYRALMATQPHCDRNELHNAIIRKVTGGTVPVATHMWWFVRLCRNIAVQQCNKHVMERRRINDVLVADAKKLVQFSCVDIVKAHGPINADTADDLVRYCLRLENFQMLRIVVEQVSPVARLVLPADCFSTASFKFQKRALVFFGQCYRKMNTDSLRACFYSFMADAPLEMTQEFVLQELPSGMQGFLFQREENVTALRCMTNYSRTFTPPSFWMDFEDEFVAMARLRYHMDKPMEHILTAYCKPSSNFEFSQRVCWKAYEYTLKPNRDHFDIPHAEAHKQFVAYILRTYGSRRFYHAKWCAEFGADPMQWIEFCDKHLREISLCHRKRDREPDA